MGKTALEIRLENRVERRDMIQRQHEDLLNERDGGELTEEDKKHVNLWRETIQELDHEIEQLTDDVENARKAAERSKALQRARIASTPGVDQDGEGVVYRDFYTFARDTVLTRSPSLAKKWSDEASLNAMNDRLDLMKRTPANNLSSDVAGLQPEQHIAQIFQVINKARPVVATARRTNLERGAVSYPVVEQRPVVSVQSAEKTEAGNQKMIINMETANASTYLGGGDISWQAINWSTPDALSMWFDLAAEDYAIKTEVDAATVVSADAFLNNISSTLAGTPTYAQLMTAIAAGGGDVYANSGRMADTVYMAPDRYWYALGLTTDSSLGFGSTGLLNINGEERNLRVVVSPGFNDGEIIVGDSQGLLVAETAGAPVELRAVEPAIGGVEVGIIGAFEAVVVDPGAFALITTAS